MTRVEEFVPVYAPDLRTKHLRRFRRHFLDDLENAARGPQLQMQLIEKRVGRLERDCAIPRNDVLCTQGFEFEHQDGFGFFGASGDEVHSSSVVPRSGLPKTIWSGPNILRDRAHLHAISHW